MAHEPAAHHDPQPAEVHCLATGALGFRVPVADGLHGMSPRSLQCFVQQQPKLQQPAGSMLSKRASSTLASGTAAGAARPAAGVSPGRQGGIGCAPPGGSTSHTSPQRTSSQAAPGWLPRLPLASGVGTGGVLQHAPPGCSSSSSSSPRGQARWHVAYKFSTPLEKRLQQQLEVRCLC